MSRDNIEKWDVVRTPSGELGIALIIVKDFDSPATWASVQLNKESANPLYGTAELAFVSHLESYTLKDRPGSDVAKYYRGDIYLGRTVWREYSMKFYATAANRRQLDFSFQKDAIQWLEDQYR